MAKGYHYEPSIPAAAIFAGLFGIALIAHIVQVCKKKTWFMLVLVTATAMEVIGYVSRIQAAKSETSRTPRIISETMLVCAPAFFAAQDYMITGRMIAYVGGNLALIRDTWITKVFVCADLVTIITQIVGVVVLTGAETIATVDKAKGILLTGLSLQVVTFSIFLVIAIHFDTKSRKIVGIAVMQPLRRLFAVIYITGGLITARSIFRTIEFASMSFVKGEQSGYLITHEWPLYALDSLPIITATFLVNFIHPGDFLPTRKGQLIDGSYSPPEEQGSWFKMRSKNEEVKAPSAAESV